MNLLRETLTPPLCKCGCGLPCLWEKRKNIYPQYRRGHASRKWHYRQDIFKQIETPEDAYWLGFFYADGFVKTRGSFGFDLAIKDIEHLEKFQKYLKTDYPIVRRPGFCRLEVAGKHILPQLEEWGLVQGKSKSLFVPYINMQLKRHFIRGLFDGDGWITLGKNGKSSCYGFVGSIHLLNDVRILLHEECDLSIVKFLHDKRCRADWCVSLVYGGTGNCRKFFTWAYTDSDLYLERKYEKWTTLFPN